MVGQVWLRNVSDAERTWWFVALTCSPYPRSSIPAEYCYEFDIDYLKFLDDQRGESKRVRGHPEPATGGYVVWPQDVVYREFWFSAHQVEKNWPLRVTDRITLYSPNRADSPLLIPNTPAKRGITRALSNIFHPKCVGTGRS
jgi:hypothetical protein